MDKEEKSSSILHNFETKKEGGSGKLLFVLLIVAVLGVGTGYFLSKSSSAKNLPGINSVVNSSSAKKGEVVGSGDLSIFKDTAEGVMKEGGIEGEGQFHLERPGGDTQNVYITSSTIDLSQYLKKKVKIWGQTQKAQKAGWLMDVGKLEVLE